MYMLFVWIAVMILAVVLEAVTTQLVSIWFAAGGVAGLVAFALNVPAWPQVLVVAVVTLLLLICTRPLVRRKLKTKQVHTNADRYVNEIGIVTGEICNMEDRGQVKVMGSVWTARSEGQELIAVGTEVKVLRIEGVKLIVRPQ